MDHPLISDGHLDIRKRVVQFIKTSYLIQRQSNIVFVCGGSDPADMRKRFQGYFAANLSEFEFFEPEFAMKNYFSDVDDEPFDIAEFEELVGDLSHSIVLFPEGPGSYAEAGYFSAVPALAQKTILVMDSSEQKSDSFLMLGPAKKIQERSRFHPNIQIDYENPDFALVEERIRRYPLTKKKKAFKIVPLSKMPAFELFALIREIVVLMTIATLDDLEFIMRGLFSGIIAPSRIKKITSILVGSGHLFEVGDFGHLAVKKNLNSILVIRDGAIERKEELLLTLASIYPDAEPEFLQLLMDGRDAA